MTHHELHVAGAGGLGAGGRDLLREVRGGEDLLGERDAVVLEEDELQAPGDGRVVVHHAAHRRDHFDDQLGHVVARSGLREPNAIAGHTEFSGERHRTTDSVHRQHVPCRR